MAHQSLKVRGKFLTRLKEDGETIVLRVDFDQPGCDDAGAAGCFLHHRSLSRLSRGPGRLKAVSRSQLRELLADAWRLVAPGASSRKREQPRIDFGP